jgi:simple sugar transport system ATP-binding protein
VDALNPILLVRGLTKRFGHVQALDGIDFDLDNAEIHAIVGDKGAGKSTLIKILSGVLQPDEGFIELKGHRASFPSAAAARAAGIETVYQDLALATGFDAGENIFLGREVLRGGLLGRLKLVDRPEMRKRSAIQLESLGITLPSPKAPVSSLSGGQRQAVAIARAAAWGREVLIMDEPLAALGARQSEFVIQLIRRMRDERGLSVLVILHNIQQVLEIADRVTVLYLGRTLLTCAARETSKEQLIAAIMGSPKSFELGLDGPPGDTRGAVTPTRGS